MVKEQIPGKACHRKFGKVDDICTVGETFLSCSQPGNSSLHQKKNQPRCCKNSLMATVMIRDTDCWVEKEFWASRAWSEDGALLEPCRGHFVFCVSELIA